MNFSLEMKEKIPFSLFVQKKRMNTSLDSSAILKERRDIEVESKIRVKEF